MSKFNAMLQEQIRNEFSASQQYVALAVWFDGQDLPQLAKHFYRPSNDKILAKHADQLKPIDLFPITLVAKDWDDASKKYFADGGIFDAIHTKKGKE